MMIIYAKIVQIKLTFIQANIPVNYISYVTLILQ